MAHTRQSRPDSGPGFQVKFLKRFQVVPFSLGGGVTPLHDAARSVFALHVNCGITIILDVPDHKNPEAYTCTLQVSPPYTCTPQVPLSRTCGTCKTVKASFWPWLSGKSS